MFTGIVEELGAVESLETLSTGSGADAVRLTVRGPLVTGDVGLGDSIAVNGVCLTVAARDGDAFTADVMRETLQRSSLGALVPGAAVNLERAVTAATRLGGHIVQGHVDATGTVLRRTPSRAAGSEPQSPGALLWEVVEISLPAALARYLVPKGSIAVDGVSLTVVEVHDPPEPAGQDHGGTARFTVSLIPETLTRTTLGHRRPGEVVNLEVDVIAKYVERMVTRS